MIAILATLGPWWGGGFFLVAVVGGVGGSWFGFSNHGLLLDPIYPVLAFLLVYMSATSSNYLLVEKQKRRLRGAFSRYVSDDLVEEIVTRPDAELGLGGETREITVLFSDVRDFTKIAERLDAGALTQVLNQYFTPIANIVMAKRRHHRQVHGRRGHGVFGTRHSAIPSMDVGRVSPLSRCTIAWTG